MVQLLESTGIRLKPDIRNRAIILDMVFKNIIPTLVSPHKKSLIDNDVIRRVLGEYLTMDDLAQGLPLYVSVFSNDGYIDSIVGSSLAFLGVKGNKNSEFLRIQDLPPEDMWKALLASAAIPILLEQQEIGGERYIDGGLGGMLTAQGNTPISPLIENGCNPIIVTSLSDRLAWKKQESKEGEFHDVRLIGIDREESIDRNLILPEVFDVLSFTPRKISSWIRQGYDDAIRCVKPHLFLLKREPRQ
jgi:NTE family protein